MTCVACVITEDGVVVSTVLISVALIVFLLGILTSLISGQTTGWPDYCTSTVPYSYCIDTDLPVDRIWASYYLQCSDAAAAGGI